MQDSYRYIAYQSEINPKVVQLLKEGCGVRSIGRILQISPKTVIQRIKIIASRIPKPTYARANSIFELDEMKTFIENKNEECWIIYGLCRKTKQVIDFVTGRRTKANLEKVVNTALLTNPRKICTDGLPAYPGLIPKEKHNRGKYHTLRIERHNLTLSNHLKRLGRKTLSFSRSEAMLEACLRIYFWG